MTQEAHTSQAVEISEAQRIEQTMATMKHHREAIGAPKTLNPHDITSETSSRLKQMDMDKEVEKYKSSPRIKDNTSPEIQEILDSDEIVRVQIKDRVKQQVIDEKLEWEFPGMILKTYDYQKHTGGKGITTGTILRLDQSIYTVFDFDIRDPKPKNT